MTTIINKKGTAVWLHLTANDTVVVAGNDSVSNIASNGEVVTGCTIRRAIYGSGNTGYWKVARGSNTAAVYNITGVTDYYQHGIVLDKDRSANLVITLNGSADGYLMLELSKEPESLQNAYGGKF